MKEGTQTEGRGYLMTEGGVHRHWTQTVGRGYLVADGGGTFFTHALLFQEHILWKDI